MPEVVGTLSDGAHNGGGSTARTHTAGVSSPSQHYPELPEVAWCLQHRDAKGADSDTKPGHVIPVQAAGGSFDAETFVKTHKPMSNEDAGGDGVVCARESGHGYWVEDSISDTLRTNSNRNGKEGTIIGSVVRPVAGTLAAGAHPPALAFDARQSDTIVYGDRTGPLDTDGHSVGVCVTGDRTHALTTRSAAEEDGTGRGNPIVNAGMSVRRLTPTECERLQGFPDNHTLIPWKGKPAADCPDGPRYKALGNSMAVPVIRWIAKKIERALS